MLPEQIKTIKDIGEAIFKEKGSEFIAIVYHVDNEGTAVNHLNEIRKKYYDATHHCYAYKIKSGEFKYSDDGEPNGTAGIRILSAIEHFDLSDVLLIVVRYFGGTKLGIGPLGKAYYNSSIDVLSKSKIVTQIRFQLVELETEFNFISQIHRTLGNYSAIISESEFTDKARFKCFVKPNDLEKINIELTNLTNGQILITFSSIYQYF
jgi:uncharacterized YigZ family protein